jgi:hypothetical protein
VQGVQRLAVGHAVQEGQHPLLLLRRPGHDTPLLVIGTGCRRPAGGRARLAGRALAAATGLPD